MNYSKFSRYLQFFKASQQLKLLKRQGWLRFPLIEDVESVADHSWMLSMICLSLPTSKDFNKDLCVKIALLHDLAEVVVGDITPHEQMPKEVKKKLEDEAFQDMIKELDPEIKLELYQIYTQYESGTSYEAQIVRDIDKYEMMLQAYQYEVKYPKVNLEEFFTARSSIQTQIMKEMLQELMNEREKFQKTNNCNESQ